MQTARQDGTRAAGAPAPDRVGAAALEAAGLAAGPPGFAQRLAAVSEADVRAVLETRPAFSLERLLVLVSPAAAGSLETLARQAQALTRQRFGCTMQLYAPLYLSNHCRNACRYCGFRAGQSIARRRLSIAEAVEEGRALAAQGLRDILLVSGDDPGYVSPAYLEELAAALSKSFDFIGVEIYPLQEEGYRRLYAAGIDGVTVYQETYDAVAYAQVHPSGPKHDFAQRLATPERAARAGMRRLGLGALLGLGDWRFETLMLGVHADALVRHHWQTRVAFSFPRIQPAPGVQPEWFAAVSDRELAQMMLALRLCFPDAGLVLSTREPAALRNGLVPLGITQISAGSRTTPGGYGATEAGAPQFDVSDDRSVAEVAAWVEAQGFEPVWKDWDGAFGRGSGPATAGAGQVAQGAAHQGGCGEGDQAGHPER